MPTRARRSWTRAGSKSTARSPTNGRSSGTRAGPSSCRRCPTSTARAGSSSLALGSPTMAWADWIRDGGDPIGFRVAAGVRPAGTAAAARSHGLSVGVAFNPETAPREAATFARAADAEIVLCMSIHPGYGGQEFMPEALDRVAELRELV